MQADGEPVGTGDGLPVITDPEESARLAEQASDANERLRRWARTGSHVPTAGFEAVYPQHLTPAGRGALHTPCRTATSIALTTRTWPAHGRTSLG